MDHEPKECTNCGCPELLEIGKDPCRHQVIEIPPLVATITEYRLHRRICACCGEEVVAELPPDVPRSAFGPRLQALTATLVAGYRLSRSETSRLLAEAFGVTPKPGDVWGFNLIRRDGKRLRRGELVGWTQNMGFGRETRLFGELVFE